MKDYDLKKPSKFINYLDMNNLCGWAMSNYLPYKGFHWLKNFDEFDVMSFGKESKIGFILEVDLEYTEKLHASHIGYPLASEKLAIPYEMLSNYCNKIADKYGIKVGDVKKLIPNLGSKSNYVLYYRDLQWYLSLGMKLTKIHRLLKFKQSGWIKIYIDFNTEKRKKNAANSFEKDFFKIDNQFCLWQNSGKLKKKNQCEISNQRKRFFKIH